MIKITLILALIISTTTFAQVDTETHRFWQPGVQLTFDDFQGVASDSALCHLIVIRGVIENVQGEEYSYNLIGETHHMISFTLIREVEYL